MLKIGFDVSMLVYVGSGVATYTYNLVKNLLLIDKKNEYHLFYSSFRRPKNFYYLDELKKLGAHIHSYPFPPRLLKLWWGKWHIIPIEWFTGKVDFFHTSDFLRPPLLKRTRGITTVHDLAFRRHPEWHTREIVEAHLRKMEKTVKYGDLIICPSEFTKKELLHFYPQILEEKITVIPEGVDEKFRIINDKRKIDKVLKKYKIKKPYILYVGAIEPRKNLIRLIKAYFLLINTKSLFVNVKLVIAGRMGWKNKKIFFTVKNLELEGKVIFTGFVEDEDLPYLYNGAKVFVYPSLYEGFGLPVLEAQACGCPVVASDIESLREIGGSCVIYVNPNKVEDIKDGIAGTLNNRQRLLKKGRNRKKFSWRRAADKFLTIFQ